MSVGRLSGLSGELWRTRRASELALLRNSKGQRVQRPGKSVSRQETVIVFPRARAPLAYGMGLPVLARRFPCSPIAGLAADSLSASLLASWVVSLPLGLTSCGCGSCVCACRQTFEVEVESRAAIAD